MKRDGRYRFTLQFGSDSKEKVGVGEFLESLGNKKSAVVVAALNDYLVVHPELQRKHCKIEVKVDSGYSQEKMEQTIRKIVKDQIAKMRLNGIRTETSQDKIPETMEDDIAKMLDNLDMF